MARVQVLRETSSHGSTQGSSTWALQWCRYMHDNGQIQYGYRLVSKRASFDESAPEQSHGQPRIPSIDVIERVIRQARSEGWGDYDAERISSSAEEQWAQGPTRFGP